MTDIKLKKQISELRNSLFDKDNEDEKNLTPANINSKSKTRSSGIFDDVRSMDKRLERLEETFYNYAYDSTKILTSFHRNTKVLEQLINNITKKNDSSAKTINKIEKLIQTDNYNNLIKLGFESDKILEALSNTNNNFNDALNILVN